MTIFRHGLIALVASVIALLSAMMVIAGFEVFYIPLLLSSLLVGYHAAGALWMRP